MLRAPLGMGMGDTRPTAPSLFSTMQAHRLHVMRVQVDYAIPLVAHKVERGGGAPSHDAHALREAQHGLQLRDVHRVELQQAVGRPYGTAGT